MKQFQAILLGAFALATLTSAKTIPTTHQNDLRDISFRSVDTIPETEDKLTESRRQFIVDMAREAFLSIGKSPHGDLNQIVASLSTLWLMGLKEEFARGKQLIAYEESIFGKRSVAKNLAEQGPGALLSAFVLSGDESLLAAAREIAEFYQIPDLKEKNLLNLLESWIDHRMEYRYLADITGDREPWTKIQAVDQFLDRLGEGAKVRESDALNLMVQLKSYLQSAGQNRTSIQAYFQTIKALRQTGYISASDKFPSLASVKSGPTQSMNIWHCLFGSMLSLGSTVLPSVTPSAGEVKQQWELAEKITETCHLATNSTKSGLPFSGFQLDESARDSSSALKGWGGYGLEPAIAESYFVLYRLTGDVKYREWAWQLAEAIYKHSRVSKNQGYAQVAKSDEVPTKKLKPHIQPPEFLSGTLKYLFLIFSPETYLPLDEWVFTVAGHPLPVCGKSPAYPKDKCLV